MKTHNFLFHRVHPHRDPFWDPMDPVLFERCIQYISSKYRVVLLEDLVESKINDCKPLKGIATISFDDGYKDNLEYAAPVLEKYHCKASFYVVTDCIEYNRLTWTHLLEHAFLHTRIKTIDMNFSFLPASLRINKLDSRNERISYLNRLKPFLRIAAHVHRMEVIARVTETFKDVVFPQMMMSWEDLRQLKSAGHYIGSHTVSHAVLNTMGDKQLVYNELFHSGKAIEKELGYFPVSVSYPLGKFDDSTIQLAQKAGYKMGVAVEQKPYDIQADNTFQIPRMELYNEPWWKTRLRMNNWIERVKRIKGVLPRFYL